MKDELINMTNNKEGNTKLMESEQRNQIVNRAEVEFNPDFMQSPFFSNPNVIRYHIDGKDKFYDINAATPKDIQIGALMDRFELFLQGNG